MPVRLATSPADLAAVRLLFRAYADWLAVDLSFQGFEEEVRGLPGVYAPPHGALFLLDGAEGADGCVAVRRWDETSCELKRLWVRPDAQRAGGGEALTRAAIAWATAAGYDRMLLDTMPVMGAAQRLYERLGFTAIAPYRFNPVAGTRFLALDLRAGTR